MSSVQFLIGKQLGNYKVTEHIGHGGMAEVYLGHQTKLGRQVAVKVLHPFLASDQGFVSRFQREARIVATMRHPNIVQVYDFDYHEDLDIYYMVMEFIQGPTLKDRLQDGPLDIKKSGTIAAAIAEALDYAHRREMVHRDIKPGNIMFTEEDDPVLADFGIARMLSLTGLTASGAMVGTPAYMAPEIGSGESGAAASDIYSLGVVLYEMVTGRLPFEADIPMSLVMKHINDPVPSPKEHVSGLSDEFEAVILKTLTKEPEQRYATAGGMAQALRHALDLDTAQFVDRKSPRESPSPEKPADNQPLLRAWSESEASVAEEAASEAKDEEKRRTPGLRRVLLLLTFVLVLGFGGWAASQDHLPPTLSQFVAQVSGGEIEVTDEPTSPPTAAATTVVSGASTITPVPTATPTSDQMSLVPTTTQRAEVLRLYTSPSEHAMLPGTSVLAYITLRNGGSVSWPEGTRLAFVRGDQMAISRTFKLEPIAAGEQVQVLLPLRAPMEVGTYQTVWEVRLPDGRSISSQIQLDIIVQEDLPTATSTPTLSPEVSDTPTAVVPLTLLAPELQDWQADDEQGVWTGTLRFSVEGGLGDYRLYLDTIRQDTEILDNQLTFRWQKCEDFPLEIIATSGEEIAVWEGEIPYPVPEDCNIEP